MDGTLTGYGRGENGLETYTRFQVAFSQLFCYVSITLIMEFKKNDTKNHIFFIKTIQYTRLIFAQSAISLINSGFICDNHLPFSLKIAVETAILFLYMEFYFKTEFSLDYLILVSKISIFYCFYVARCLFHYFKSCLSFVISNFYRTYILFKFHNGKSFSCSFLS